MSLPNVFLNWLAAKNVKLTQSYHFIQLIVKIMQTSFYNNYVGSQSDLSWENSQLLLLRQE